MRWKLIEGDWRWPYRVSDQGDVQKQLPTGEWQTLKPYQYTTGGQWRVPLCRSDGTRPRLEVSKLVADAFMGGTPAGMFRVHKNGLKHDNAVENLVFMTRAEAARQHRPGNSRPVLKLDRSGNVVAIYSSGVEAAKANHISQASMSRHCLGSIADPYRLDGYQYIYEDIGRKRRKL